MKQPKRKNHVCPYCKQDLSHAAYYRHLDDKNGLICPGRSKGDHSDSEEDLIIEDVDLETDTSFDGFR